jgi:hypothetical protein
LRTRWLSQFQSDILLQVLTAEGALMTQPEYVLRFKPPLTITNLLPFEMTVIVTDRCRVHPSVEPQPYHFISAVQWVDRMCKTRQGVVFPSPAHLCQLLPTRSPSVSARAAGQRSTHLT